ncbi:four helix bundle protein [Patescibacteria group bacterium]|nr:four helix bundle protein [Patescibacteria group bacterium]MBU1705316.1 four helix bundle protein [Patescibacteria group bacterium]
MRFRYEDLRVGDSVLEYINVAYQTSENFPQSEQYCLTQQLRRAATSIYLNLAEGSAKKSKKEFCRFITISLGSLVETHAIYKISCSPVHF